MTQAQWIVQQAYRELNIFPVGTTGSTAEQTEGLYRLNRLIDSLFGFELGENLEDWLFPAPQRTAPIAARYPQGPLVTDSFLTGSMASTYIYPYPPTNRRIIFGSVTGTLYFPEKPNDGSRMGLLPGTGAGDSGSTGATLTLDGNGRYINSTGATMATQATYPVPVPTQEWFYRADLGQWLLRQEMTLTDQLIFPADLDDFFIGALARRVAPLYNKVVSTETINAAMQALKRLQARYRQTQVTTYGSQDIPRTDQSYLGGSWWW